MQGEGDAQYNFGVMYANGRGVPQDDTEAVKWFRKAAKQDYAMVVSASLFARWCFDHYRYVLPLNPFLLTVQRPDAKRLLQD